jgi:hypothetical protein
MKLPELSADAAPEFVDAAGCKAWLENVPLANVSAAQQELLAQLEVLNAFPASAAHRLAIMEALREAVNFVQIEQAKRFTNRALPMSEAEATVFDATIALWEEMRLGYLRCLESALNRASGMKAQSALICQRLLAYSGLKMFHHYRAYRQVPAADWGGLNEVYAHAESLGVAEESVKDFLNRDVHETSPRIAYARAVLTGMCSPNELGQRQLTFVAHLLERWAVKLEVSEEPVDEGLGVPPLVVDLSSYSCPERTESSEGIKEARYLDTRKLAKSLRNRVALLRKGESPAKLALGEDCVQPSCEQLLVFLYRQWCQEKLPREGDRRPAEAAAQACNDIAAIHHYVSGKAMPTVRTETRELTQKQRQELETLGHVSTREAEEDVSHTHGYFLEQWRVRDESPQGLRMVRASGSAGKRYTHGQVMCVRPADAKHFMLAQVRWLMQGENGDLHAGLKLLPGIPSGIGVRPTGLNVQQDGYVPALALSAVQALNAPATLVLPSGWFKPKRVIEVYFQEALHLRLAEVIERGADFERVTYEPAT